MNIVSKLFSQAVTISTKTIDVNLYSRDGNSLKGLCMYQLYDHDLNKFFFFHIVLRNVPTVQRRIGWISGPKVGTYSLVFGVSFNSGTRGPYIYSHAPNTKETQSLND